MDIKQQGLALQIARQVRDQQLTSAAAARKLHEIAEIKLGSAKIIIEVYSHLIKGLEFKRTLSAIDMEFFLTAIAKDEGGAKLKLALNALNQHIQYRQLNKISQKKNIEILEKFKNQLIEMDLIGDGISQDLEQMYANFNKDIEVALKDTPEKRNLRLASARKIPRKVLRSVYVYDRNPDVVAEVLFRAKGECKECKKKAPFLRKLDGTPYLEVHHLVPLSKGGEDTVENSKALCPNCHRELHFG